MKIEKVLMQSSGKDVSSESLPAMCTSGLSGEQYRFEEGNDPCSEIHNGGVI